MGRTDPRANGGRGMSPGKILANARKERGYSVRRFEAHDSFGPDISEEDAYPFRDFFGGEFKAVVEAEREGRNS